MKANEIPEKYKTCDWLWNYGSIGLTKEHIEKLNKAINILESLDEHTDAKYLKEIRDKLLEDATEQNVEEIEDVPVKYYEIGEVFNVDGCDVIVEEDTDFSCLTGNCIFSKSDSMCEQHACLYNERPDGKNVHFTEIEKKGE